MLIAFTGAGISAAAGIPTFQDQPGIRDKLTRTYATRHPEKYQAVIQDMKQTCDDAAPTDAHRALAEYNIPIITMNVDGLHNKAGSQRILPIHGTLPNIVLYGDVAPAYQTAMNWTDNLREGDTLLIIGTSFYTRIAMTLKNMALMHGADVQIINDNAETKVREFLENYKHSNETFDEFLARFE